MPHDQYAPVKTNWLVRQAAPDDVYALIELDTYATVNTSRRGFIHDAVARQQCLVAVDTKQCGGYLVMTHDFFGHSFIALVVVLPVFQRQGVALGLLAAAEARCKTPKLFASTNASNTASKALLAKAGFEPSGRIENLDEFDPELVYYKHVR